MIHHRIRRARLLRGLSLEALAQRLGDISRQALHKFELGEAAPNSTRLLQLAQALAVKPEYFFRADTVDLAPLEFRKLARMPQFRQHQVQEQIREHLERWLALERCFDAVADERRGGVCAAHTLPASTPVEAEAAARTVRQQWGLGSNAIANLTDVLESNGLKVALLDGPDDFDGACAATPDAQQVLIALNAQRPGERMRFTAAHELGHWLLALPGTLSDKQKETCCHRFAGALLYPAERVRADFGGHLRTRLHPAELLGAKRHNGLSAQAVLYRLRDLGLVSEAGYKASVIQLSSMGWRSQEPEPLPPERPGQFEALVWHGLAEGLFTLSRAAEFLQVPVAVLEEQLAQFRPQPAVEAA
jgi:Zn-dependent peptidase ImmA (M78 family)/transcriptional regulator with XRE-family HTH domain